MSLDPHAKRLLDMIALGGGAAAERLSASSRRDSLRKLMGLSTFTAAVGAVDERAVPAAAGAIPIRRYTPISPSPGELPGLIYFHGGGMVAGSLDTHDNLCRALAAAGGCRVIAVDYRLAPEHRFPAGLIDCRAATWWIAAHAAELGLDPERIAVGGDSSGGTLAAVVCRMAREERGPKLALQLLLCPVLDFGAETESRRSFAEGYLLDRATMERDLEHYCEQTVDRTDPLISPLRATDLGGLPPALIHTAEFDPLRDEGAAYAERLARAGVRVSLTCHRGMIHHFYGLAGVIPRAGAAFDEIGKQLAAALH